MKESKEDLMKEYIAAAKRLDNGTVVSVLYLNFCCVAAVEKFTMSCLAEFE